MARAERKHHYIYKITYKVTNRFYIGMHSTDNMDDGYFGSGKRLWFSINYHGKENHEKEILEFCSTRAELKKREKEIVTKELLQEDLCMNLVVGGEGGGFVDEDHLKRFQSAGTKAGNLAYIEKVNTDKKFQKFLSNRFTSVMLKKHREGKVKYDTFTGKKHSEDTKKLMSQIKKTQGLGNANSQYGTCWITRDGENKKIKKEELDSYVNNGWIKGRTCL